MHVEYYYLNSVKCLELRKVSKSNTFHQNFVSVLMDFTSGMFTHVRKAGIHPEPEAQLPDSGNDLGSL